MGNYSDARTIARVLIKRCDGELTTEIISDCVDKASGNVGGLGEPGQRDCLVRELEASYQTVIGQERELVGKDEGWSVWLPARKGDLSLAYWQRYQELLSSGLMANEVIRRLDRSTDRVLGYLGDPQRPGSWDRRGLVVGLVQSGKTSHYLGLANKAVDAGYKVIVVLTGFTESLRVQTQIRAEEGILGYYLEPGDKRGDMIARPCGVGRIAPEPKPDSVTTRAADFSFGIAKNFSIQIGGNEILFVIKKNASVLHNLLNWIENNGNATGEDGRKFVRDVPLLVIDDESDVGSVDTKKMRLIEDDSDPEHEPSRINAQIRKLLYLFDQSSYVGYTATPFANVLIHDEGSTKSLGDDLFPRSFIISLPTPSDHVGPSMIFGQKLTGGETTEGLPVIRHVPDREAGTEDRENAWIPPVHKKSHRPRFEGRDEVPPSLRRAILSFVLICAARKIRKSGVKHNSMLVHVTRFNDVQHIVTEQVEQELKGVVDRLRAGTADSTLREELLELWNEDFLPTTQKISERDGLIFQNTEHRWEEIESQLLAAVSSIQVRTINGLAAETLDYLKHESGLNVIAIGGNKLSRGLTLEGLSVSYFLRCSRMYDTLMQMGRWFGYREGYLDLCRLYATSQLCEWFNHIACATTELQAEFDHMADSGATPKEFGLRVRSHPDLMVTSQVKMRDAQKIQISFQGELLETISFRRDRKTVEGNWAAAEKLISALEAGGGARVELERSKRTLWKQVSAEAVMSFLAEYREHESARKVRTKLLSEYIEKEAGLARLIDWSVLLVGGSGEGGNVGGVPFHNSDRSWHLTASTDDDKAAEKDRLISENRYRISHLGNPVDESLVLNADEKGRALTETVSNWEKSDRRQTGDLPPTQPGGVEARRQRGAEQGLLMLYPLEPGDAKSERGDVPVLGFALSFPKVVETEASAVTYTVNNVFQQMELFG